MFSTWWYLMIHLLPVSIIIDGVFSLCRCTGHRRDGALSLLRGMKPLWNTWRWLWVSGREDFRLIVAGVGGHLLDHCGLCTWWWHHDWNLKITPSDWKLYQSVSLTVWLLTILTRIDCDVIRCTLKRENSKSAPHHDVLYSSQPIIDNHHRNWL